jgi:16S rRNA (cytidine1402-2'-O)-methyltransferase
MTDATEPKTGTLFVAATPLGNLQDISARLGATLTSADLVLAEDTRRSRIVLEHLGLKRPLRSLHSHNELNRIDGVLAQLHAGDQVVLLSDAGTPAVSDPGAQLVAAAHAQQITVCPIPGPSALTAALSAAGFMPGESGALFLGFLPRSGTARTQALRTLTHHRGVAVVFESPERLGRTLRQLTDVCADRPMCLCRELTKIHEEVVVGTVSNLAARYAETPPRGEITFVLGPLPKEPEPQGDAPSTLKMPESLAAATEAVLAVGLSAKDTAAVVAQLFGVPKREVYALAIAHKSLK